MATVKRAWQGGAATATQVATLTVAGNWDNPDTITTTLFDENGASQAVQSTATGTDEETDVVDVHVADLQNSVLSEFVKVTWVKVSTDKVQGTAKVAGRPFTRAANPMAGSESTSGTGTYGTLSVTTANAGPNDWNDTNNWVGGTIPLDTDVCTIGVDTSGIAHSVLYGLNQSGIDLNQMIVTELFRRSAMLGNMVDSKYLLIDISDVASSTDDPILIINGQCRAVWVKGNIDAVAVNGAGRGNDAVKIYSTNSACVISVNGFGVRGQVRIAANSSCATVANSAAGADVRIETPITGLTNVFMNAGQSVLDATTVNYHCGGGKHTIDTAAAVTGSGYNGLLVSGGTLFYNSSGTLTKLNQNGGTFTWEQNFQEGVTMTNGSVYSGTYIEKGADNVTHTNNILNYGGNILVGAGTVDPTAQA